MKLGSWIIYDVFQVSIGSKIIALTASLPSLGAGALKNREDPKLLGTSKVSQILHDAG